MQQLFVQKGCMRLLSLPVWGEWIEMQPWQVERQLRLSLPVWGEWIEITCPGDLGHTIFRSLPVWGEWIEISRTTRSSAATARSLPVWGEWIEIFVPRLRLPRSRSLPVWGEWIEMGFVSFERHHLACLSPCGESGLKLRVHLATEIRQRLSPCGESGLKSIKEALPVYVYSVSPRVGRVD